MSKKKEEGSPPAVPPPLVIDTVRAGVLADRGQDVQGRWYWRAVRYTDGGRDTLWTGRGSREEARQAILEAMARGPEPEKAARGKGSVLETFEELVRAWLFAKESDPSLSPRTKKMYRSHTKPVVRLLGKVAVERVRLETLEQYRNARRRENAKHGTISQELLVIRTSWSWGRQNAYIPDRDLPRVKVEKRKEGDERHKYTPTEGEFWKVFDTIKIAWLRTALVILRCTGSRIGEAWNLTWEELDEQKRTVVLHGKRGARTILVDEVLLTHLADVRPEGATGRVMESLGLGERHFKDGCVDRLATACKKAGVQRFSPQGIRRLAVDEVYRSGADVGIAAAWAGHSPAVALAHYRRATLDDQERLVALAAPGRRPEEKGKVVALPTRQGARR